MAQETIPVQGLGTSAAPLAYPVAVGDSFDLMAAFASFDGSGAGSAWVPALQVLAPSGAVMVSTIGSSVAAGGSADVTFAPFLEGATTGGGGGITPQQGVYNAGLASVPGVGGIVDASWTYLAGDAVLNLTNPAAPTAVATGLYLFSITVQAQGGGISGRPFDVNLYLGTTYPRHQEIDLINPVGGFGVWGQICDHAVMAATNSVIVRFVNNDNTAHSMGITEAHVVFIPT